MRTTRLFLECEYCDGSGHKRDGDHCVMCLGDGEAHCEVHRDRKATARYTGHFDGDAMCEECAVTEQTAVAS